MTQTKDPVGTNYPEIGKDEAHKLKIKGLCLDRTLQKIFDMAAVEVPEIVESEEDKKKNKKKKNDVEKVPV